MKREPKFDIALSFAGEDRKYVDQVAILLRENGISVFYDLFEEANLWGKNLYDYLSDIYQNQAKYTIMFISEAYNKKLWTNHERQSMQSRAFQENEEYILPVKFDDTKIPGVLPTIGYIDLKTKTPEQLVDLIEKKLINNGGTIPSESLRKALSTITPIPQIDPLNNTLKVFDNRGNAIAGAQVVLSANNGTFLQSETNKDGIANFTIKTRREYSVIVAHSNYPSAVVEKYDPNVDLEITLNFIENIGSMIIQSTGYISGLQGRLNPILDTANRMYLYADNIAVDGGKNQPVHFALNQPLSLEDSQGVVMNVIFRFINGRTTALIDYIKPVYKQNN
jgi:hypothetical protein